MYLRMITIIQIQETYRYTTATNVVIHFKGTLLSLQDKVIPVMMTSDWEPRITQIHLKH